MGQDPEKLPWSGALGNSHFGSIMATWACLALKVFQLHLKALKSLLSPCLIALKAFKPLLQDGKTTGAKPLAPGCGCCQWGHRCPAWVAEISGLLPAPLEVTEGTVVLCQEEQFVPISFGSGHPPALKCF